MKRGHTHIAGNRLDLVMTDVPDIVDAVVGTELGTSDHCLVSCVLRVQQSVPEYNVEVLSFQCIIPTGRVEALYGAPF